MENEDLETRLEKLEGKVEKLTRSLDKMIERSIEGTPSMVINPKTIIAAGMDFECIGCRQVLYNAKEEKWASDYDPFTRSITCPTHGCETWYWAKVEDVEGTIGWSKFRPSVDLSRI